MMHRHSTLSRRSLLQTCAASALAASFPGGVQAEPAAAPNTGAGKPPNLLVFLSDDQVFTALGAAGNPHIQTPVLDALAASGTRFSQCDVSNPICTPIGACLLTGQYGFVNGVTFFGHTIREDAPRLPRLLQQQGYAIGYTGKWHNDGRPQDHGVTHTSHVFLGGMHDYDSIPVVQGVDDAREVLPRNPTELFTDAALELMQSLPEPWCLFVSYTAPHDPRTPPPEYEALYDPETLPLPPNFLPHPPAYHASTLDIRDEKLLPRPLDPAAVRIETARYYGLISHMDTQIGRILDALEQSGKRGHTLVAFAGDNGLTLGAHGLLGKQTMYEEGLRMPLILSGPGIPAGATDDRLCDLMDLMPTLLAASGATAPAEVHGRSLLEPDDRELPGKRLPNMVFAHYEDLFRMVRQGQHKLIHYLKEDRYELFDLNQDPHELHDKSLAPEYATTRTHLIRVLETWRGEMQDPAAPGETS